MHGMFAEPAPALRAQSVVKAATNWSQDVLELHERMEIALGPHVQIGLRARDEVNMKVSPYRPVIDHPMKLCAELLTLIGLQALSFNLQIECDEPWFQSITIAPFGEIEVRGVTLVPFLTDTNRPRYAEERTDFAGGEYRKALLNVECRDDADPAYGINVIFKYNGSMITNANDFRSGNFSVRLGVPRVTKVYIYNANWRRTMDHYFDVQKLGAVNRIQRYARRLLALGMAQAAAAAAAVNAVHITPMHTDSDDELPDLTDASSEDEVEVTGIWHNGNFCSSTPLGDSGMKRYVCFYCARRHSKCRGLGCGICAAGCVMTPQPYGA